MNPEKRKYTIDEIWELAKRGFTCKMVNGQILFGLNGVFYDLSAADIYMIDGIINKGLFVVDVESL